MFAVCYLAFLSQLIHEGVLPLRDKAAGGGCKEQGSDSVWVVKIRDLLMSFLSALESHAFSALNLSGFCKISPSSSDKWIAFLVFMG